MNTTTSIHTNLLSLATTHAWSTRPLGQNKTYQLFQKDLNYITREQTEISQQLYNGLPQTFVQTSM